MSLREIAAATWGSIVSVWDYPIPWITLLWYVGYAAAGFAAIVTIGVVMALLMARNDQKFRKPKR